MKLLDGRELSTKIINSLKNMDLRNRSLHIILVGNDLNSLKYVDLKQKRCKEIGLNCELHHLPQDTSEDSLINLITNLNNDTTVSGFFIQLPVPDSINEEKVVSLINPQKDIDGLTENSTFLPAVVRGVITLLDHYKLYYAEKSAVIINSSKLIGIPLKKELEYKNCHVQICNKSTKNIQKISRGADFIFTATGVKGLITHEYIKPGAVVVDIGGGDVNFTDVSPICSYITPTIGGVGPMTIASLLQNLAESNS